MANYLNTRIKLRYDTLENWKSNNPTLLDGELAIVAIPTSSKDLQIEGTTPPQILFKVGPGAFNSLPYASGKAADVYAWAKQANLSVEAKAGSTGNVVSNIYWDSTTGGIKFETASVATSEGLKDIQDRVKELEDAEDNDTTYTFTETTKGFSVTPKGGSAQTFTFDYLTQTELTTYLASNNITVGCLVSLGSVNASSLISTNDVQASSVKLIPEGAPTNSVELTVGSNKTLLANGKTLATTDDLPTELGVMDVDGENAIEVSGEANKTVSLKLDATGNVVLSQGTSGLKAAIDLSAYQTIANDQDTKYGIEYDSVNKLIKLTNDSSKSSISAADFVKDGMLQSVSVDNAKNTITFTWNTDGATTATTVNLSDIADIYTAAANATEVQVAISNTNEISASLVNGGITEAKLHSDVTTKLNKVWEKEGAVSGLRTLFEDGTLKVGVAQKAVCDGFGADISETYAVKEDIPTNVVQYYQKETPDAWFGDANVLIINCGSSKFQN